MNIPKEILDEVYNELLSELESSSDGGELDTFDEIEGAALRFGRELEKRAIEKMIEKKRKTSEVKKNATHAEEN